jgi:hypothetical protein
MDAQLKPQHRSEFQHKRVMDAQGQVAAKIWILTQKVMDSHLKLQQRAGHNTKRVCIV